MDVAGENHLDIDHGMWKQRLGPDGAMIGEAFTEVVSSAATCDASHSASSQAKRGDHPPTTAGNAGSELGKGNPFLFYSFLRKSLSACVLQHGTHASRGVLSNRGAVS